MSSVLYSPEAESDLLGIAEYIARDKPEAARNWFHKIRVWSLDCHPCKHAIEKEANAARGNAYRATFMNSSALVAARS